MSAKRKVPSILDFTTINRRTNKVNISIDTNKDKVWKDEYIIISIDSNGINVTYRYPQT